MSRQILLDYCLVVAHILSLNHRVVHDLSHQFLCAFVDLAGQSFSAGLHPREGRSAQCFALVAPNEPVVGRSTQDLVELALVLQSEQSERSSPLVVAKELSELGGVVDFAVLGKLEHGVEGRAEGRAQVLVLGLAALLVEFVPLFPFSVDLKPVTSLRVFL